MGHSEYNDLQQQLLIHNAEWKLVKSVLPELLEMSRPASRSRTDRFQSFRDGALKINGSSDAALSIPLQGSEKFLLGFGVKSDSLTCHEEEFVLSAELLPKES
jgi:hypothetical protein